MTIAEIELDCAVRSDRSLSDCHVVKETVPGAGNLFIREKMDPNHRLPEEYARRASNGRISLNLRLPFIPPVPANHDEGDAGSTSQRH